jgi:hypothetical protein
MDIEPLNLREIIAREDFIAQLLKPCARCAHSLAAHQHYRPGTDCSLCTWCRAYTLRRSCWGLEIGSRANGIANYIWLALVLGAVLCFILAS